MGIEYEVYNDKGIDKKLFKSKNKKMIRKIGTDEIYSEALDLMESTFEYEETGIDIIEKEELEDE